MAKLLQMPAFTYSAKLFETRVGTVTFKTAGTLDGFIDLATPNGTYQLSQYEAQSLIVALGSAVSDVRNNCLYNKDPLLLP